MPVPSLEPVELLLRDAPLQLRLSKRLGRPSGAIVHALLEASPLQLLHLELPARRNLRAKCASDTTFPETFPAIPDLLL
eukprot:8821779-Prorocentrum_lima.AAC.1